MKHFFLVLPIFVCIALTACGDNQSNQDDKVDQPPVYESDIEEQEAETQDSVVEEPPVSSDFDMDSYKKKVSELTDFTKEIDMVTYFSNGAKFEITLWDVSGADEDHSEKVINALINALDASGGKDVCDGMMKLFEDKFEDISSIDTTGSEDAEKLGTLVKNYHDAFIDLYNLVFLSPGHTLSDLKESSEKLLSDIEEYESEFDSLLK